MTTSSAHSNYRGRELRDQPHFRFHSTLHAHNLGSPVGPDSIQAEIAFARAAFSPWLSKLQEEIDSVFRFPIPALRRNQIAHFLRALQSTGISLEEYDRVIQHLPTGGAQNRANVMLSTSDLLRRLSDDEKEELRNYLVAQIKRAVTEFPELAREFHEQFARLQIGTD